jgi:NNP family nitrate/nitrite transporter-like MFS transporter
MLLVASFAGLGGGNFASSMANISFFYPDRMKGWALGLNAAGGNIGVSSVQLLTPILMGIGLINLYQAAPVSGVYLQNAGLMWVLPIAIAVFGAVFFMNNLTTAKASIKNQVAIVKQKHTWIMSFIYIGTFGSFIGYSAAFPLLIKTQFPAITIAIAFLGPLVGSLVRPIGGLLADKVGGAIVTFWNFIAMAAATIGVLYFVGVKDFAGFLVMFLILFVTTGIGNGSTYRMIPSIFREQNLHKARGKGEAARAMALKTASIESGAAVGFIGAVGAVGGFLIPMGFGKSIAVTGGPQVALMIYLAFYAACLGLTWWFYLRKGQESATAPSLAEARI